MEATSSPGETQVAAAGREPSPHNRPRPNRMELFRAALGLGAIGFGGGLSVLASIQRLVVDRRHWLTEREFLNTATVAQMLPGGAAANALAYMGLRFGGMRGALIGYLGFILPGAVATILFAWVFTKVGSLPNLGPLIAGLNAAVVGIIVSITLKMVRTGIARMWQMGVAGTAMMFSLAGDASSGEIALLGVVAGLLVDFGLLGAKLAQRRVQIGEPKKREPPVALPEEGQPLPRAGPTPPSAPPPPPPPAAEKSTTVRSVAVVALAALAINASWWGADLVRMAAVFFRTGLGAYGGGFAIIPSLDAAMRAQGWLTDEQFAAAVAVGKLTPGPVLLMATFIGFLRQGLPGAITATAAIFAAPYISVIVLGNWINRVRSRHWIRAALSGLTPAVVGLMAAAGLTIGRTVHDAPGLAIAGAVALTLSRFEVNPVAMLAVGGVSRVLIQVFLGS